MKPDRLPWFRFYTADWRGDAGLRRVGFAARGLWMDMLSLMHEATPCGHLRINGQPLDTASLAEVVGGKVKEVQGLLERLEQAGVFSRTEDGVIFSRRMVRDSDKAKRDRDNGRGGGNPALVGATEDNRPVNGGVNPEDKAYVGAAPASLETRKKDSVPSGTAAPSAAEPASARDLVWREGVPIVAFLTGKPPERCRPLLGKLLRNLCDDCPALLQVLQQAREMRPVDPEAWLLRATDRGKRVRDIKAERDEAVLRAAGLFDEDDAPTVDHFEPRGMLQ